MDQYERQPREQQTVNLAEIFLQQSARLLETQTAAARTVMRTQARSLAAFGAPDVSSLYAHEDERQFSDLLKTSADHVVSLMRQTNETVRQFQEVFNQIVRQQTTQLTEQMRASADEIKQRTQEVQQLVREASQQAAQQFRSSSEQGLQGSSGADERARSKLPA